MTGALVYILCTLTSAFCAVLLWREYRRSSARLLFWGALSFVGWALNNSLVFMDFVVYPGVDLSLVRAVVSLTAISLLLYGLIGDAA
jgi:hypothetical protein